MGNNSLLHLGKWLRKIHWRLSPPYELICATASLSFPHALPPPLLLLQMRVEVYISFGGLLLLLVGDPKKMERLEVDSSLYLLMKRVD